MAVLGLVPRWTGSHRPLILINILSFNSRQVEGESRKDKPTTLDQTDVGVELHKIIMH